MNIDLSGQVAIVTGAGRGIGKEIASVFARCRATVVLAARSADQFGRGRGAAPAVPGDPWADMTVANRSPTNERRGVCDVNLSPPPPKLPNRASKPPSWDRTRPVNRRFRSEVSDWNLGFRGKGVILLLEKLGGGAGRRSERNVGSVYAPHSRPSADAPPVAGLRPARAPQAWRRPQAERR